MLSKVRTLMIALLIGLICLSGSATMLAQTPGPPPPGAPGARQSLDSFFRALAAGDLVLLKTGGALSGTVQGDQFIVKTSSGQSQTLARSNIALMSFGDKTDQLVLMTGDLVSGSVQVSSLSMTSAVQSQSQVVIPKAQIATIIFKITPPSPPSASGSQPSQNQQQFFKLFQSLQSQNLFALFAKSMTSYDLVVFPSSQQSTNAPLSNPLLSGKVVNTQIVFESTLFGTLTFKASDVASIELAAASASAGSDFITLKTGDRLTGTLDDSNPIQFQPVAMTDSQGQPVTLTFKHGDISEIIFRLPASAFGGGSGPGFQGGPGR